MIRTIWLCGGPHHSRVLRLLEPVPAVLHISDRVASALPIYLSTPFDDHYIWVGRQKYARMRFTQKAT